GGLRFEVEKVIGRETVIDSTAFHLPSIQLSSLHLPLRAHDRIIAPINPSHQNQWRKAHHRRPNPHQWILKTPHHPPTLQSLPLPTTTQLHPRSLCSPKTSNSNNSLTRSPRKPVIVDGCSKRRNRDNCEGSPSHNSELRTMSAESPSSVRKVVVHLRATGDAPILKQSKFKIAGTDKFVKVIDFLRRQLHRETLFVYVNSAFSPNPDELVIDLFNVRYHLIPFFPLIFISSLNVDHADL
ncbi:hypothetical protein V8G54_004479, partial [Vigna mungo]